ncbi:MAG TPA: GTPase ObgE [Patescibacteria group bacterium]|nr:GTPase ObgE [Patescibacteria group bacterium]
MLVDDITITIKAGDGGNGAVSFKRNAQTAKGGPDGGNGGNGGNIYIQGVNDILGLRDFRFKKEIYAENGIKGAKQNLFGRNGEDTIIDIPVGTLITDEESGETWEVQNTNAKFLIGRGGIGGRGNNEFKSATNQTPRYAEKGTEGQERHIHLELRLIADIGFIGLPNAGKSSLLAALTNAQPKIANYPFTTLEPHLGMLSGITLADIPGLIEGASSGKGLGMKFLRHIEKTKLLVHCIDASIEDVLSTYDTVRKELQQYNSEILEKPEVILLTKSDLLTEKELAEKEKLLKKKTKKEILITSVINDEQLKHLQSFLLTFVKEKSHA